MIEFVIVAVVIFVTIPPVLYLFFSKRKTGAILGFILAGIHLVFVLCVAGVAYRYKGGDFTALVWYWVILLDIPISLPFFFFYNLLHASLWPEELFCLAYFGVLGSAQYFLWGVLLARLFARKHSKTHDGGPL